MVIIVNETITKGLENYEASWYKNNTTNKLPVKKLLLRIRNVSESDFDDYFCLVRDKRTNETSNLAKAKMIYGTEVEYDFTTKSIDETTASTEIIEDISTSVPITQTDEIESTTKAFTGILIDDDDEGLTFTTTEPLTNTEENLESTTTFDITDYELNTDLFSIVDDLETTTIEDTTGEINTTTNEIVTKDAIENDSSSTTTTEQIPITTRTDFIESKSTILDIKTTPIETTSPEIETTTTESTSPVIITMITTEAPKNETILSTTKTTTSKTTTTTKTTKTTKTTVPSTVLPKTTPPIWLRPDFIIYTSFSPQEDVYLENGASFTLKCNSYASVPTPLSTMAYKDRV